MLVGVLLTCFFFFITTSYYLVCIYWWDIYDFWTWRGKNPPGVLSEVQTCRCAPLNQCDMKSCSDGISMIIATALLMYHVDYKKTVIVPPKSRWYVTWTLLYFVDLVLCLYLLFSSYIQVHFIFFIQCSLIFPFDPLLGHDFLHVYKIIS